MKSGQEVGFGERIFCRGTEIWRFPCCIKMPAVSTGRNAPLHALLALGRAPKTGSVARNPAPGRMESPPCSPLRDGGFRRWRSTPRAEGRGLRAVLGAAVTQG